MIVESIDFTQQGLLLAHARSRTPCREDTTPLVLMRSFDKEKRPPFEYETVSLEVYSVLN